MIREMKKSEKIYSEEVQRAQDNAISILEFCLSKTIPLQKSKELALLPVEITEFLYFYNIAEGNIPKLEYILKCRLAKIEKNRIKSMLKIPPPDLNMFNA